MIVESPASRSIVRAPVLLVALCPLIAVSDTLVNAIGAAVLTALACLIGGTTAFLIRRWIADDYRVTAHLLTFALSVGILELATLAWFPRLGMSLGVFLPLIACNLAILQVLQESTAVKETIARMLRLCGAIGICLVLLGAARELVGHGSLMHDAGTTFSPSFAHLQWSVFDLDMGFLLAMLPPGAFISLGLLLALVNWLRRSKQIDR